MFTNLRDVLPARGTTLKPEMASEAKQLNEQAQERYNDPAWHAEQAAVIAEAVDLGYNRGDNVFSSVIDTRTVGLTDVVTVKLRYGIEVFSVAEGGYVDESTLKTEHFTMGRDTFGWHIVASEFDVLSDWAETFADIVRLARVKEQMELVRRQYALLDAAIPVGGSYYVDASAGLTSTILNTSITNVYDAPRKYSQPLASNSSIQIIGRASAVDQITSMSGFTPSDNDRDQIQALGFLGRYRGADIRRLSNYVDEYDTSFFPANELWVVSPGAGRFVLYGGTRPNQWVEPALRKTHVDTRRSVGGAIWQPQVVRRIKVA